MNGVHIWHNGCLLCVDDNMDIMNLNEPRHVISNTDTLTWIDSDAPVQPPFKVRNSK